MKLYWCQQGKVTLHKVNFRTEVQRYTSETVLLHIEFKKKHNLEISDRNNISNKVIIHNSFGIEISFLQPPLLAGEKQHCLN